MTQADRRTLSFKGLEHELERAGASSFDTVIPRRESIKNSFGHAFGDDLDGYEGVWDEIEGAIL